MRCLLQLGWRRACEMPRYVKKDVINFIIWDSCGDFKPINWEINGYELQPPTCPSLGWAPGDREGKHFETQGRAWQGLADKAPHFFKGDSSGENPQVVAKLSETFRLETMFHVCCLPLFQTNSWGLNPSIGFWFQKKPSNNLRYGKWKLTTLWSICLWTSCSLWLAGLIATQKIKSKVWNDGNRLYVFPSWTYSATFCNGLGATSPEWWWVELTIPKLSFSGRWIYGLVM